MVLVRVPRVATHSVVVHRLVSKKKIPSKKRVKTLVRKKPKLKMKLKTKKKRGNSFFVFVLAVLRLFLPEYDHKRKPEES